MQYSILGIFFKDQIQYFILNIDIGYFCSQLFIYRHFLQISKQYSFYLPRPKRDDRSFDLIPEKEQKSFYLTFYFTKKVKSIFSIIYFKLHEGYPWKLQTKRNLLFVCIRGLRCIDCVRSICLLTQISNGK